MLRYLFNKLFEKKKRKIDEETGKEAHNHFVEGNDYSYNGNYEQSISEYIKAIELNPNVPVYHYNLGNSYANLKKFNEAIKSFSEAIKLHPKYNEAYRNRGTCYSMVGNITKANKDFKLAKFKI